MKKIIIRTPNFIGDTINTTPCIQLIKEEYPNASLIIVGPEFVNAIFKYDKRISKIITFPLAKRKKVSTYLDIWNKIRKEKADLGIIFVNTFVSALEFRLAHVRYIIGYSLEKRRALLDFSLPMNRNKHYINRYASLFNEFIGNKYTTLPALYLPINKKNIFTFDNDRPTIGFYPGGSIKGYRRYPSHYVTQLIKQIIDKGYNIVLVGSTEEGKEYEKYIRDLNNDNIINLAGKTNIEEFFNIIDQIDLLITIDSAAMHIAAALRTPFIALFGLSTSPISTITPKVNFGRILKIENNIIREEDYMNNLTPDIVCDTLDDMKNNGLLNIKTKQS